MLTKTVLAGWCSKATNIGNPMFAWQTTFKKAKKVVSQRGVRKAYFEALQCNGSQGRCIHR